MRASLGLLMPLLLLQACAGSPVAQQLEGSFQSAEPDQQAEPSLATNVQPADAEAQSPQEPELKPVATADGTASAAETATTPEIDTANETATNAEQKSQLSAQQPSKPYRITIRLASADPAAPAEVVTRALRNAQVSFSVERIERIETDRLPAAAGSASSP